MTTKISLYKPHGLYFQVINYTFETIEQLLSFLLFFVKFYFHKLSALSKLNKLLCQAHKPSQIGYFLNIYLLIFFLFLALIFMGYLQGFTRVFFIVGFNQRLIMIDQSWPFDQNGRVLDTKKKKQLKALYQAGFAMVVLVLGILVVLPNLKTRELFLGLLILREIRPTLDKNLLRKF